MFRNFLESFREEDGQGLVEYGLILLLVALVVVGILTTMGGNLNTVFTTISDKLAGS